MTGCQDTAAVTDAFVSTSAAAANMNIDEVTAGLSQGSLTYVEELSDIIREGTLEDAGTLGRGVGRELTTMLTYATLGPLIRQDSTKSELEAREVLLFMMILNGQGFFRDRGSAASNVYDEAIINGQDAILPVKVPLGPGGASVLSNYQLHEEEGRWKINLLSTTGMEEKVHRQNQRRSRLDAAAYIRRQVESEDQDLPFQYRKN